MNIRLLEQTEPKQPAYPWSAARYWDPTWLDLVSLPKLAERSRGISGMVASRVFHVEHSVAREGIQIRPVNYP